MKTLEEAIHAYATSTVDDVSMLDTVTFIEELVGNPEFRRMIDKAIDRMGDYFQDMTETQLKAARGILGATFQAGLRIGIEMEKQEF